MPKSKQKFEVVAVDGVKVTIDMSYFQKTGDPYFNATDMAIFFNKKVYEWRRREETKEYIFALKNAHHEFKDGADPLLKIKKGKYGGTYLHKRLALQFARWCSPDFEVALDDFIYNLIEENRKKKEALEEAKTGFRPLTNAVQKAHEKPKGYHFSTEADLFNRIVVGMSAADFRKENNLPKGISIRPYLNSNQLDMIKELQQIDTYLIKIGVLYDDRKKKLIEFYKQETKPKEISHEDEAECTKILN